MNCSRLLAVLLAAAIISTRVHAQSPADTDAAPAAPESAAHAVTSVNTTTAPQHVVIAGTPDTDQAVDSKSWYSTAWDTAGQHLSDIWHKGDYEVYVPFWTYHLPFAYSAEKRTQYTEHPWGGGVGKGWYNNSGNWEGIYMMAYQDSHGKPMYTAGYGWVPTWRPLDDQFKVGVGLTAFIFMRSDIGNYAPIPAALPVASVGYGPLDVQVAYVPGGQGNGNVLFWWAKFAFR